MKSVPIFHGTDASPEVNWFAGLKRLVEKGRGVLLPHLPNSATPNIDTYNKFLLNADLTFNSDTFPKLLGFINDRAR